MVVADAGVEADNAARTFAVLGGVAARFDLQRTERVGTNPHEELPRGRLGDVKTIQQGEGLVRLRTGDVRLPEDIVDDPGNKVQRVAVVAGVRVGQVDNVNAGELLLIGDLRGIDSGRRLDHIDYLAHLLLVAVGDTSVIGFVAARQVADREFEILNVAVAPAFRRRGVARGLLCSLFHQCQGAFYLEVRESNLAAHMCYKSLGFQTVTYRPAYYENPSEPAIVMKFHSC